jgi:hypothetical protein
MTEAPYPPSRALIYYFMVIHVCCHL